MISTLNILQANLYRSSGVQDALYNDPDIWDFDAILIQEPHYWEIAGHLHVTGAGPNFEIIKPKTLQRETNHKGPGHACGQTGTMSTRKSR